MLVRGCFRYHKGTDFQANHNCWWYCCYAFVVVLDTTKVQIFKQITTQPRLLNNSLSCFRYHKGTDFQANHNYKSNELTYKLVVLDTTKVQIFKQITTIQCNCNYFVSCFRYHKGTDFQANHNHTILLHFLNQLF